MATTLAANRIAERKLRDKQARRAQIISAARRIAELEGWSNVTVRRLSDEISHSQPVLYAHFASRIGILAAVAIEGFQELGLALQKARKRVKHENTVESVAAAYLEFAASSPALYEVRGQAVTRTIRNVLPCFLVLLAPLLHAHCPNLPGAGLRRRGPSHPSSSLEGQPRA
jgi:AcrR family transcriptional regulator